MAEFNYTRLPRVTAEQVGETYRLTVYISGIAPTRSITGPENLRGWVSLDPPTIEARTVRAAKSEAILCTQQALASTDGVELNSMLLAWSAYSVGYSSAGALQELGLDA